MVLSMAREKAETKDEIDACNILEDLIVNDYDEEGLRTHPDHTCPTCGSGLERLPGELYCPKGCDKKKYYTTQEYRCPKCNEVLEHTESEGLWCRNGCFDSEFELWEEFQKEEAKMIAVEDDVVKEDLQAIALFWRLWMKMRVFFGAYNGWRVWRVVYQDGVHTALLTNAEAHRLATLFGGRKYIDYGTSIYFRASEGVFKK